jgi:hypothetical protein
MNLTSYYDEFKIFQSEIEAGIIRLISETKSVPHSAYEHWQAFSHAVNWQQTWIRMILSFHVGLYVLAYCTRQNVNIQSVIFFLIIIIVGFLERINNFCANNWRIFSDQNYFDKHGVFAGVVVAMPLLALGFFQLVCFYIDLNITIYEIMIYSIDTFPIIDFQAIDKS